MADKRKRILESVVRDAMRRSGGVLIEGAKAVGKTTLGQQLAASDVYLDRDPALLRAVRVDPTLALEGAEPRLIDEYQRAEGIWEAVRGRIDDEGRKGMFILTGSAMPADHIRLHTGAMRITRVTMRTMSLFERDLSSGAVSIGDLLDGATPPAVVDRMSPREAIEALVVGGWPSNLDLDPADAAASNRDYLDIIATADISQVDGVRRDPNTARRLLRSYARNVATPATTTKINHLSAEPIAAKATLYAYLGALERLYLIEDQEAWAPRVRSRTRLTSGAKRHLADPSLAVAALGVTPERLLGPAEIDWAGYLFESQVVHDLRIYAEAHGASVLHYRSKNGRHEADAIVEHRDGRWIGVEIKLGQGTIDHAAESLLKVRENVEDDADQSCAALIVVVSDSPTYRRDDGVIVTSVAALGP